MLTEEEKVSSLARMWSAELVVAAGLLEAVGGLTEELSAASAIELVAYCGTGWFAQAVALLVDRGVIGRQLGLPADGLHGSLSM